MKRAALAVIDTGSANLASVVAALRRAGGSPIVTRDADVVHGAERIVLPGVGTFGDVMRRLTERGLVEAARARAISGEPMLCICLGLQMLASGSEESPGVEGLGVLTGVTVRRFPVTCATPQLGWNRVTPVGPSHTVREGHAYFANSFYIDAPGDGWKAAWATHGVRFVAALERGPQLACQFHPELSGRWGASLIERWLGTC